MLDLPELKSQDEKIATFFHCLDMTLDFLKILTNFSSWCSSHQNSRGKNATFEHLRDFCNSNPNSPFLAKKEGATIIY